MSKTYEGKAIGGKCECCGKPLEGENAKTVDVTLLGGRKPQKWKVCKNCCSKRVFAEALAREIEAYWARIPAEG